MKILNKTVILVLLSLIAFSCNKNENVKPSNTKLSNIPEEHLKIFNSYGYGKDQIISLEDKYVVDGDIVFEKKDFSSKYDIRKKATGRHYWNGNLVASQYRNIAVTFDSNVPNKWKEAVRRAISNWNQGNSSIHFYECQCSSYSRVLITYKNFGVIESLRGIKAEAYLSFGGRPGGEVSINSGHIYNLSDAQREKTMTHELGHTIGFQHTDDSQDNLISVCNQQSDSRSVMNTGNQSYTSLSTCDHQSLNHLY